jgi:hypothetical protein
MHLNNTTTKPMENKQTALRWLQEELSLHLSHEQKVQFEGLFQQSIGMYNEDMSRAYTEGFKRCKYIRELSTGVIPDASEPIPDDFDIDEVDNES